MKHLLLGVGVLVWLVAVAVFAADFTQPERDVEFIKYCKRQDAKMNEYFGDMLPGSLGFAHEGRFRVLVTRNNIERRLTLVPIKQVPYASLDELKVSVWGNHLPIGYLDLPYANADPPIPPSSYLLEFDGIKVHLLDYMGYDHASFPAKIELAPNDPPADNGMVDPAKAKTSIACIQPNDELRLYMQFSDTTGKPLMDETGYPKILVSFTIKGLTEDETVDKVTNTSSTPTEK